jgi:hypothetical protein
VLIDHQFHIVGLTVITSRLSGTRIIKGSIVEPSTESYSTHISQQFNEELENIRTELLTMGGIVERQVSEAVEALLTGDADLAEKSRRNGRLIKKLTIKKRPLGRFSYHQA